MTKLKGQVVYTCFSDALQRFSRIRRASRWWPMADIAKLSIPMIRLLLLITGSLRICSAYRLGEVIVIAAAMDAQCHHLARRDAAGIEVFLGQPFAHDVTVGAKPIRRSFSPIRMAPMSCSHVALLVR